MKSPTQTSFEKAAQRITESNDKILDDFTTEYRRMEAVTMLIITEKTPDGMQIITAQALVKPPGWQDSKARAVLTEVLMEQILRLHHNSHDGHGVVQFNQTRKHDDWKD